MAVRTDGRCRGHRRTREGGAACSAAAPDRLPPPTVDSALALDQRAGRVRDADVGPNDLQRPSAPLLGPVRRQLRPSLAVLSWAPDPGLGDHSLDLQSCCRAAVAPGLRLAAGGRPDPLPGPEPDQSARAARPRAVCGRSEAEPYLA